MNVTRRDFLNRCLFLAGASILEAGRAEALPSTPLRTAARTDYPGYLGLEKRGLLAEREEKLAAFYESCRLCPRNCRVDRLKGEKGVCQASARLKFSGAFPHFGEERPLVGRGGSGTIFFSHCGLRCVYCQNFTISIEGEGVEVTEEQLAETMVRVQGFGCHNINLVTPTHYVPGIVGAVRLAARRGLKIPLVYNTSGYETLETLQLLDGIVDIYLPDFKYWHPAAAAKYSSGAYNYPYHAKLALKEMHRQVGKLEVDERGVAVRGVILRHLILPRRIAGTEEVIKFIARELSPETYVNLMSQYRPEHKAMEYQEISRRLTRSEYAEALEWAKKSGLTRLDR